ncbi:hypothetical protein J3Q64DRAFT_1644141 [Phycomyces blakesleeanus]|uniref:GAR domain-containing protein n=1 Tax=Phycomyces blakesleeanus TaxID=4837 RepID=A0ABR3ATN2_PHYBL
MAAPIPDREIREILNLHESLTLYELMDGFDTITSKLLHWLESAHLAVFTLEQNVKEDTMEPKETQPLTEVVNRMEPYIGMLIEIGEALEEKYEDQDDQDMANRLSSQRRREAAKSAITKIQYEWSGLQHFLASVIKQVDCANEKKELIRVMERVSLEMDDMSTMIFQFQERRHAVAMATSSSTFTSDTPQQSAISENEKWLQQKGEDILAEIDSKVEPLFHEIERVHARMKSGTLPVDRSGVLAKKHLMVQEKWEYFRIDLSELKNDVKEERWQAIFRQVANEVDTMIEGLDKAAIQCHNVIQQVRDWHATLGSQTNPSPGSFDRFSRSLLRSTTRSAATATPVAAPPLDREKFRAVAVSFEAKYKYYTPNIDRMLTMLASGIASRASQHSTTQKRHQSMLQRWNGLKAVMDDLRTHDLVDTERLLIERQASPEQRVDRNHNNWKGIRYRPDQESIETRSRSPYGTKPTVSPSSKAKTNTKLKPASRRTKTPGARPAWSSSTKTEKQDFSTLDPLWKGEDKASSMGRQDLHRNNTYLSPVSDRERAASPAARRPSPSRPPPEITSLSPPTNRRPTSPIRRAATPSMIPRPKTPSSSDRGGFGFGYRANSPSVFTRPRSSMLHLPPVPQLPNSKLLKKQSMPMLAHHSPLHDEPGFKEQIYKPNKKDPLDIEVAAIVNANPVPIQCERVSPGVGRYYFGNELSPTLVGGKKMYTCKLMNYAERDSRRGRGQKGPRNKVLVRVGGGWQDLELFLLHQAIHY